MHYREILIGQLKNLPYFDKQMIYQLNEQYKINLGTVDAYISRSLARQELVQLKKGTYVTADYFKKHAGDISYTFYLANILRQPSYVSSWTALQYYDLTTEAIHTITSVTPKITRTYNNQAGNFIYHSIQNKLFTDFILVKGNFNFFMATPAKALFDLVYFKTKQLKGVNSTQLTTLIEDLRIDISEMDKKDRDNFHTLVESYLNE